MVKKFIKSFIFLLSSSVLGSLVKFFLTIYWVRIFTTEDFGKYSLILSWLAVIQLLSGFGIANAVARYCQKDYNNVYAKDTILISTYKINILISGIVSFIAIGTLILIRAEFDYLLMGICLMAINFCQQIIHTYTVYNTGEERHTINSKTTLANNLLSTVLALLFVYMRKEISSIFAGIAFSYIIMVCYIWFINFRKIWKVKLNLDYLKVALIFGLPTVLHNFATTVLSVGDRTMIEMYKGVSQTGIYSGLYQVSKPLEMVILVISQVWSTRFYKEQIENNDQSRNRISIFYAGYFNLLIIATAVLIFFSPYLVKIILPESYHEECYLTGIICSGMLFLGYYHISVGILYYNRKTKVIALSTMLAAVINIFFNWLLIPKYGLLGAGISTLVSYLVMSTMILYAGRKYNHHFSMLMSYLPYLVVLTLSGLLYYIFNNKTQFICSVLVVVGVLIFKDKKYFKELFKEYKLYKGANDG